MHPTELLEQFRTGTTGPIHCVILNATDKDGKPVTYEREGDRYAAGLGDGIVKLMELIELRRRCDSFWGRFFYSSLRPVELDIAIKRLREVLNSAVSTGWTE